MVPPKITLYVDTVSPFAYIAYYVLRNDPVFRKCDITYVPILLGGLMKMCGNAPPLTITNKNKWINKERQRWVALFNVPMKPSVPPNFPPRTLPIMRALAAIQLIDNTGDQSKLTSALDALWDEFFAQHAATHEPAELSRVLTSALGKVEAGAVLEAAMTDEAKKRLSANTDEAFAKGAFGLPWMVCTNEQGQTEGFWGVDHLGQVAAFLGLERPGVGTWKPML